MGATQSARPKVLVYGAPHAGKKSLVKALGDAEFELFTTDDGANATIVIASKDDTAIAKHGAYTGAKKRRRLFSSSK